MANEMEVIHDVRVEPARTELSVEEVSQRLEKIETLQRKHMKPGVDYGIIPGTGAKPTLLKPGAEKLCVMFQMGSRPPALTQTYDGDHLTITAMVTLFHIPTGTEIGTGTAICSSKEKKYAYRGGTRTCPKCAGQGTIIKGKPEYGGGWLCWKNKGGCGAKFPDTAQEIVGQKVDRVTNPDLPDEWNTVVKMAVKRAKIDAVLSATGASAIFTQDLEDEEVAVDEDEPKKSPSHKPQETKQEPQRASTAQVQDNSNRFTAYYELAKQRGIPFAAAAKFLVNHTKVQDLQKLTSAQIFEATVQLSKADATAVAALAV